MENNKIVNAFTLAGAAICGVAAVVVTAIIIPAGAIALLSAAGAVAGAIVGAKEGYRDAVWNGKSICKTMRKSAFVGFVSGATGALGIAAVFGAAAGFCGGAAIGSPVQIIADCSRGRRIGNGHTP